MEHHKIVYSRGAELNKTDETIFRVIKGAGICFDNNIFGDDEKAGMRILEFAKNHDDAMYEKLGKEICLHLNYDFSVEDVLEAFDMCGEHFHDFLARIISKETEIPVKADKSNNCIYVLFEEKYPWMMPRSIEELTPETLEDIFQRYINEFSNNSVKIDYYELIPNSECSEIHCEIVGVGICLNDYFDPTDSADDMFSFISKYDAGLYNELMCFFDRKSYSSEMSITSFCNLLYERLGSTFAEFFVNTVQRESGVFLELISVHGKDYILFRPCFPWGPVEPVQYKITPKKLEEVFSRFILEISNIPVKMAQYTIQYVG